MAYVSMFCDARKPKPKEAAVVEASEVDYISIFLPRIPCHSIILDLPTLSNGFHDMTQ